MTTWCVLTPERVLKTQRIMDALAQGWPEGKVCMGEPPNQDEQFIAWGQIWVAEKLIREALPRRRPFFQIDNGFYKAARGEPIGYYRFMYSRPNPVFLDDWNLVEPGVLRNDHELIPFYKRWRKTGKHILVAMPGPDFGLAFGIDCREWSKTIVARVKAKTDRPVIVRDRFRHQSLEEDLHDCWAVVTHSSNVAVEAVLAGVPCFVEPTAATAPLGNLSLDDLETPAMPYRDLWWASLMCQQFTIDEMRNGTAYHYLSAVKAQVDASNGRA